MRRAPFSIDSILPPVAVHTSKGASLMRYQAFAVPRLTIVMAAVAGALFVTSVGGCASDPGRERSTKAVGGLQATRDELADGRKQIDKTLAALNALETSQ